MEANCYILADKIVQQLQEVFAVPSDDPSWQQARAVIATELVMNRYFPEVPRQ